MEDEHGWEGSPFEDMSRIESEMNRIGNDS
jgi:hypothetical protein